MIKRNFVEHFVDADAYNFWRPGIFGFFIRLRGIYTSTFASLIGGGFFSWWVFIKTWENIEIQAIWAAIFFSLIITAIIFIICLINRKFIMRSLQIQWVLHGIIHFIRDKVIEYAKEMDEQNKVNSLKKNSEKFFHVFIEQLVEKIKDYFRIITKDNSVECAIRIADKNNNENAIVNYYTIGRSSGFNQNRSKTTEAIPINEGIPRILADKDSQGILVYHDLDKSSSIEVYKKTNNDKNYSHDLKTLMVAPINGLDEKKKVMLGLLYITSKKDPFREKYVDSFRAIADLLGSSFPQFMENFF